MPTTREDLSERRCRWLRSSGASRSCSLQEPQIERREHQDYPDVYHQALQEPMPEEQDVHADHDGYQREHVEHDACVPSHRSILLLEDCVAAIDDPAGRQHRELRYGAALTRPPGRTGTALRCEMTCRLQPRLVAINVGHLRPA